MVGTRPECIKMAPLINELRRQAWARTTVVSTGQHRELVKQILDLFDIEVDHDLDVMQPNQSLNELTGRIFMALEQVLSAQHYDLLLVQGDTTSVMSAAVAAFHHGVPVGHVEAGLRTYDLSRPFPEEANRRITSLISQLHFAPTENSRDNLLREHVDPATVFVTGNTVIDALLDIAGRDPQCPYPVDKKRRLILITAHRRESFGAPIIEICRAVRDLHDRHQDLEFVYPVHPNPNVRRPVQDNLAGLERVHLIEPAGYEELIGLMKASYLILTDSGGIQEEAPALGKPVLILRDETERPEVVTVGAAQLVGAHFDRIVGGVEKLLIDHRTYASMASAGSPFGDGLAAKRIASICHKFLEPRKSRDFLKLEHSVTR